MGIDVCSNTPKSAKQLRVIVEICDGKVKVYPIAGSDQEAGEIATAVREWLERNN